MTAETPPGECRQCWAHAHDPSIHAQLPPDADCCQACVDCKNSGHAGKLVPKKPGSWW